MVLNIVKFVVKMNLPRKGQHNVNNVHQICGQNLDQNFAKNVHFVLLDYFPVRPSTCVNSSEENLKIFWRKLNPKICIDNGILNTLPNKKKNVCLVGLKWKEIMLVIVKIVLKDLFLLEKVNVFLVLLDQFQIMEYF
uniref:Uncharacterized protein n=1 Tax=Meloidogyne enterolobii TaxID=390850 RepID=A0A6V7XT76_MELEN|nr:unnamed protein product [Meloidogyne enterolobii]